MRAALVVLASALGLVLAGCGGEADAGAAADLLKPGALVYWETVSDPESEQWQQVEDLLRRFPDGDKWIAQLRSEFEEEMKVTWAEVREALGDRTVVAVYADSTADEPAFVALTDPEDTQKSMDVIRKLNEADEEEDDAVARVVQGWVVVSDKQASIDAALAGDGGRTLADEEAFASGLEELPEDSLSRAYVDVATAVKRFAPELQGEDEEAFRMFGLDEIDFAGAWATAEDEGAKVAAVVEGDTLDRFFGVDAPFSSELLERVPDDAFAFLTFRGEAATTQLDQLRSNPLFRMGAREIERFLGVTVEELARLFEGEIAFYARPAAPIPELTLLLDAENPEQSRQSAETVLRALASHGGGEVTEEGGVTTARFEGFTISLGTTDGLVVLSTSRRAISGLEAGGGKLPDSDRFQSAMDAAGAPDSYTGLVYVDLAESIKLLMDFFDSSDEEIPPAVARNLEPLRSFVAYGTLEENTGSVQAFLEID